MESLLLFVGDKNAETRPSWVIYSEWSTVVKTLKNAFQNFILKGKCLMALKLKFIN